MQRYLLELAAEIRAATNWPVEPPRVALEVPPSTELACIRNAIGAARMVYSDLASLRAGDHALELPEDTLRCRGPWCAVPLVVMEPEGVSLHVAAGRTSGVFRCNYDSRLIRGAPAPDGLFVSRRRERGLVQRLPAWAGTATHVNRTSERRLLSQLPRAMPAADACGYAAIVPSPSITVHQLLSLAARLEEAGWPVGAIDWQGLHPETRRSLLGSGEAARCTLGAEPPR